MRSWVLIIVLMFGCAATAPPETDVQMPELVSQVPLPALSRTLQGKPLKLELKIHVGEDGSVQETQFVESSGDLDWDRQALEKVRQWKFAPALHGGKPISIWIRQSIVLEFSELVVMSLAEIRCSSSSRADSVYEALVGGADFGDLARRFSVATTAAEGGVLGRVDIRTFPHDAQRELQRLVPGEFTRPIRIGPHSVLFLRLKEPKADGPSDGAGAWLDP